MDNYEKAFADHILSYMGVSLEKREFVGRLLLLQREDPDKVEKTNVTYGNVTETILGKLTHASRSPVVISSDTFLQGIFTELEKEKKTIKNELSDYLREKGIWIPNAEIVQYGGFSYCLEAEKMDGFFHNIHFSVKRD